jgi:hypothetical protein
LVLRRISDDLNQSFMVVRDSAPMLNPRSGALALGLLLTLTACGGGGGGGDTAVAASDTSAASDASDGDTAYRDCLAEQGVELPDFGTDGGGPPEGFDPGSGSIPPDGGPGALPEGFDQEAFQKAMEACADLAPEGGLGAGPGGGGLEAFEAYRSCLADNGVEVPETTEGSPPASIDETDPDFAAANEVCQALLPDQAQGTTTTTMSEG